MVTSWGQADICIFLRVLASADKQLLCSVIVFFPALFTNRRAQAAVFLEMQQLMCKILMTQFFSTKFFFFLLVLPNLFLVFVKYCLEVQ